MTKRRRNPDPLFALIGLGIVAAVAYYLYTRNRSFYTNSPVTEADRLWAMNPTAPGEEPSLSNSRGLPPGAMNG